MKVEITGDAIKSIAAHLGAGGVQHLLDSLRMQAEAELIAASASSVKETKTKPGRPPRTPSEKYARLWAEHKGDGTKRSINAFSLVYCASIMAKGSEKRDRKFGEHYTRIEGADKQELAKIAKWLKEQDFEYIEQVKKLRKDVFPGYATDELEISFFAEIQKVTDYREQDVELPEDFVSYLLDVNSCRDIAEAWATGENGNGNLRNFPARLKVLRARRTSDIIYEDDLLKDLSLEISDVRAYPEQWQTVMKWANNNILIVDDSGRFIYE